MTRQTATAKNGTEAFKMIHDFLGKEISFSNVSEGYNREDIFTFTAGEGIFISATGTPDNSRVECIEIINTNEGGSARHPLTVYINADDAESTATAKEETKMKNIEMKIAKNGNVSFYAEGTRINEQDAVHQVVKNGGAYYSAHSYSYSGRHSSENFLSPITAYKWLRRLASKNRNHADGAWIIKRHENRTCTEIYETADNVYKCEDAVLEAYIEAREAAEHIKIAYKAMTNTVENFSKHYGITIEQAEQIVVTIYAAEARKQYASKDVINRMVDEFRAANTAATVEAVAAEYAVNPDALQVTVDAEIALAAQNVATVEKENVISAREKFLNVKKNHFIRLAPLYGRKIWYVDDKSPGKAKVKKILAEYGLTPDEYLAEQKKWVDEKNAEAVAQIAAEEQALHIRDKIRRESKSLDDESPFTLLPALDELNDVDDAQSINTPIIETVEITEDGNEFRRFTVNNETVTYFNGELNFIKSDTYHASLAAYRNQYVVEVPDGHWKKFKRLDVDEFHRITSERGACSIDGKPEPPVAPQSDFAAKLAALKDAYDKAEKVVAEKKIVLDEAEKDYRAAGNISTAALIDLQTFLIDAREQLTKELLADIESPYEIAITAHNGLTYKTKLRDAFFLFGNVGEYISFLVSKEASCINWELATYDTLDKMKIAIEMLKAAIARGDKSFTFPPAKTADAWQEINSNAPDGWSVDFDAGKNNYTIKFGSQPLATLDSLALAKVLPLEKFFEQFKPLVDKDFDADKEFISDRLQEINQLIEMREELADDPERLKIVDELIRQNKRDIIHTELAG